jgi:hypothetical protein
MEEMRERLAKATKAAAALAESLEPFEGAPLHKLQDWIAKQEGDVKCGQCGAPLPRGNDATICIACGTERVPSSPHAVEFNFKLSFAFLQFLESIHPPSKVGSYTPTLCDIMGFCAIHIRLSVLLSVLLSCL